MRFILLITSLLLLSSCNGQGGYGCWFDTVSDMQLYNPNPKNWHCVKAYVASTNEHYSWNGTNWVLESNGGGSIISTEGNCPLASKNGGLVALIANGAECITIDTLQTIDTDLTIPENTRIEFIGDGLLVLNASLILNGNIVSEKDRANFQINNGGELIGNPSNDVFHAEWFGAVRDSVTNDFSALQKTLDLIQVFGGGTLELLKGTYYITEGLIVHSNTIIRGQGMNVTHIQVPSQISEVTYRSHVNSPAVGNNVDIFSAFSMGDEGESGHNITFHDFHINMNDHIIGYGNTWGNNNNNIDVARGIDRDFSVNDDTNNLMNIEIFRMWIENVQLGIGGGNRTAANIPISIKNTNIRVYNNYIDGTSNKAIEFQETEDLWVYGNKITRAMSCIQCFAESENVFFFDNTCEFTNGGIFVSLGSKNSQVHNNIIKWTGEGLAFGRWEVGSASYPVGIMYKNDNADFFASNWANEVETRDGIISDNLVDLTGFTANNNAKCFSFRSNAAAPTRSGDNWSNLYFDNNVFVGGDFSLDAPSPNGLSNALTVSNIHISNCDFTKIVMESSSRHQFVDDVYVRNCLIREQQTLSSSTSWTFMGNIFDAGILLDSSTSNKRVAYNIGTVTNNGTGNIIIN